MKRWPARQPLRDSRLHVLARGAVNRALQSLPDPIRACAQECVIQMELMTAAGEEALDRDLLGLFEGASRMEASPGSAGEAPRIRLFLDNLWEAAEQDPDTYRQQVRITLLHELGHYLGLDEDQVADLGLA